MSSTRTSHMCGGRTPIGAVSAITTKRDKGERERRSNARRMRLLMPNEKAGRGGNGREGLRSAGFLVTKFYVTKSLEVGSHVTRRV